MKSDRAGTGNRRAKVRSDLFMAVAASFSWIVLAAACLLAVAALHTLPAAAEGRAAEQQDEWHPEMLYGPMMAPDDIGSTGDDRPQPSADSNDGGKSAASGIAAWAQLVEADGPQGRPLPLTGSWMADRMFGPDRFVEMIEAGHYVMPTFSGISLGVIRRHLQADDALDKQLESWRPALDYARRHKLPIAFREWNWSSMPPGYQQLVARLEDREIPLDEDLRVIEDGKPGRATDPFGPVEGWRQWGEIWFGNRLLRGVQEIYPNPPMVIFLNNNEGPKVRSEGDIHDDYPRMIDFLGGRRPEDAREKQRAIRVGYTQRYDAMFQAARDAMVAPTWKENVRFVGYNLLWDTGYIGQGDRPRPGIWFEPDHGWLDWRMYQGVMPELYDNDWQPGKRDYGTHSPQFEAMNYHSVQPWLFERDPHLYWATIVWDGGRVNDVFRGRRSSSKPFWYITRGQRWDFARYEGWVQFTLWTTRPRSMREFRFPASDKHAYDEGTFMAVVRSVDRPWTDAVLREFWRFGRLVPNPDEGHPWELSDDQPPWVRDLPRWYLLTCDANPPRDQWHGDTSLRVFAQALVLGTAPQRRWLIYAHAPLGALAEPTVVIPQFGEVTLASVPKSGAFFLLDERTSELTTHLAGGPAELSLRAERQYVAVGQTVGFEAQVAHAPGANFTAFTWDFGDGRTQRQASLEPLEHAFDEPGTYLVSLRAVTVDQDTIVEQTAVHVGEPPAESVKYDLPLDDAFAWEGPWADSGEPDHKLVTYRHVPNAGTQPDAVLVGGGFVDDADRGRVLAFGGESHQGLWLIRNRETVLDQYGFSDQTISLWFQADDSKSRQILYAQGYEPAGFNLYLYEGALYAGSWATSGLDPSEDGGWYPVWGRDWKGHWLKYDGIEAGRWYHVTLELNAATENVEAGKQRLYVGGKQVAAGPGVRVPRHYAPPQIGAGEIPGRGPLTRFHDSEQVSKPRVEPFRGRVDQFRFTAAGSEQ